MAGPLDSPGGFSHERVSSRNYLMGGGTRGKARGAARWEEIEFPTIAAPGSGAGQRGRENPPDHPSQKVFWAGGHVGFPRRRERGITP